jgi:hypothetical protein
MLWAVLAPSLFRIRLINRLSHCSKFRVRDLCVVLVGLFVSGFGRLQSVNDMNEVLREGFVYQHN